LGFTESANVFLLDNKASYFQFSANWENIDYFAKLELTGFNSDAYVIPKSNNYYLSFGYNFAPYTLHVTAGQSNIKYDSLPNEIPFGVSPQLDFLGQQFTEIFRIPPLNDSESITVGLRYEWLTNLALKADVTFLQAHLEPNGDNARANFMLTETELLQVAVEWVF
jgi:hypothetical protein